MRFWGGTAFLDPLEAPVVAGMLEQAGFEGVLVSDHVTYPKVLTSRYPGADGVPAWGPETAWPDPWVLIGAMAAVTTRLRFGTNVYIAPSRPLLAVAKQVATASHLSGGRVSLGVGVGWMREEFDVLGQDFTTRGRRLDEMMDALRALWKGGWVSWEGEHYRVPELMLEPHPPAPVPILCGGESDAALRRAAWRGDGWIGFVYSLQDAVPYIERLQALRAEHGRDDEPFEVIVALTDPPSVDLYRRAEDAGITGVMCMPSMFVPPEGGVERHREPIERFGAEIIDHCR